MPSVLPDEQPSRRSRGRALAALTVLAAGVAAVLPTAASAQAGGAAPGPGDVIVEEFRFHGPNGANDEYIELYNTRDHAINLDSDDDSADPRTYVQFWTGTAYRTIALFGYLEPREHVLIANVAGNPTCVTRAQGYSLNGDVACADLQYNGLPATAGGPTRDIPADGSVVVFYFDGVNSTDLDKVGFESADADFFETTPLKYIGTPTHQHTWVRRYAAGKPVDSGNNANDFVLAGTTAATHSTPTGPVAEMLGAPGPQACDTEFKQLQLGFAQSNYDPTKAQNVAPNQVYTPESDPNTPEVGHLLLRRVLTNTSGKPVRYLRLRVGTITTRNSQHVTGAGKGVIRVADATGSGLPGVLGLDLESPPSLADFGGHNSTLRVPLTAPLAPNSSVPVEFRFKVDTTGTYTFGWHPEMVFTDGGGFSLSCPS